MTTHHKDITCPGTSIDGRLDVYIPMAECERPVWESLESKLKTFDADCEQLQKRFFQ